MSILKTFNLKLIELQRHLQETEICVKTHFSLLSTSFKVRICILGELKFLRVFRQTDLRQLHLSVSEPNSVCKVSFGLVGFHQPLLSCLVSTLNVVDASEPEHALVALRVVSEHLREQNKTLVHL